MRSNTHTSGYAIGPQTNPNYKSALLKYIAPNATITKVNNEEVNESNPFSWEKVASITSKKQLMIECTHSGSETTGFVFPKLAHYFYYSKLTSYSKNMQTNEPLIKNFIDTRTYRCVELKTINKTEALYLLGLLQKQYNIQAQGAMLVESEQAILIRINGLNYYLHYGKQAQFALMPTFHLDLDDGFSIAEDDRFITCIGKIGSNADNLIRQLNKNASSWPSGFCYSYKFINIELHQVSINKFLKSNFKKDEILPIKCVIELQKLFLKWKDLGYEGELISLNKSGVLSYSPEKKKDSANILEQSKSVTFQFANNQKQSLNIKNSNHKELTEDELTALKQKEPDNLTQDELAYLEQKLSPLIRGMI